MPEPTTQERLTAIVVAEGGSPSGATEEKYAAIAYLRKTIADLTKQKTLHEAEVTRLTAQIALNQADLAELTA